MKEQVTDQREQLRHPDHDDVLLPDAERGGQSGLVLPAHLPQRVPGGRGHAAPDGVARGVYVGPVPGTASVLSHVSRVTCLGSPGAQHGQLPAQLGVALGARVLGAEEPRPDPLLVPVEHSQQHQQGPAALWSSSYHTTLPLPPRHSRLPRVLDVRRVLTMLGHHAVEDVRDNLEVRDS